MPRTLYYLSTIYPQQEGAKMMGRVSTSVCGNVS
jgi:hypothetical protein